MEAVLTSAEAQALLESHDLIAIGVRAVAERRRRHGDRVTFVRVAHVGLGPAASPPPAGIPRGAREVRLSGAVPLDAAVEAVRAACAAAGSVPVTGFDLSALRAMSAEAGRPLKDVASALRGAGLVMVSEVTIDRADDLDREVEAAIREAAAGGLPVARIAAGAIAPEDRLRALERVESLARALGPAAPRAFAPLPLVPPAGAPSTGYDDVKLVALARLVVSSLPSIQVDWDAYGPKLAQVALLFGADDLDNVTPDEPSANLLGPRRAPIEEVRRNIVAASLEPVERDGRFAPVE